MRNFNPHLTRRRVISILAAGVGLPLVGRAGMASPLLEPFRWQGVVLGAAADLTLYAASRGQAVAAIDACLEEAARLEATFSLHQPDSALARLNRDGQLSAPPFELVELLSLARHLSELSAGRFDPTIQPLWKLIADHFSTPDADPAGPSAAVLDAAREKVNYRALRLAADRILFERPGMQVTLNGIAQGYITDRIGAVLQAHGFRHALVNLGEALAIDRQPDGQAWRIGIVAPGDRSRMVEEVALAAGAVATSAAQGMLFDAAGRFNHLIDPRRFVCADRNCSITVLAGSAAVADGLSTLGAILADPLQDFAPYLSAFAARAYVISGPRQDGRWLG